MWETERCLKLRLNVTGFHTNPLQTLAKLQKLIAPQEELQIFLLI